MGPPKNIGRDRFGELSLPLQPTTHYQKLWFKKVCRKKVQSGRGKYPLRTRLNVAYQKQSVHLPPLCNAGMSPMQILDFSEQLIWNTISAVTSELSYSCGAGARTCFDKRSLRLQSVPCSRLNWDGWPSSSWRKLPWMRECEGARCESARKWINRDLFPERLQQQLWDEVCKWCPKVKDELRCD